VSGSLTVECEFHFKRADRGARKVLKLGPKPSVPPARIPRIARFMALAIRLDQQMRDGVFANQREIGAVGGVTRARVAQIMLLLNLAPDIQEEILFSPPVEQGRDPIILREVLPIAAMAEWRQQRKMWTQAKMRSAQVVQEGVEKMEGANVPMP
jgi:hypothetical protein